MKTQRVTLLTTPEFKEFLTAEARREGVSVAEFVRSRCAGRQSAHEAMLATLTAELRGAIREAKTSLRRGLEEANAVLAELHAKAVDNAGHTARARPPRKVARARS